MEALSRAKISRTPISKRTKSLSIAAFFTVLFSLPLILYLALLHLSDPLNSKRNHPYVTIEDSIDETVDPCDNFYAFACGKWSEHASKLTMRKSFDTFTLLQDSIDKRMKDIFLSTTPDANLPNIVNKALKFYNVCIHSINASKPEELDPNFQQFLTELGGCPLLGNSSWNEEKYDWIKASGVLLRWFLNGFAFRVNPMLVPNNTNQSMLVIHPPAKGLPVEGYIFYIIPLLVALGSDLQQHDIYFEIQEMVVLQNELKEIQYNKSEPTMMTIGELKQEVPEFDWLSMIQEFTNETFCNTNCYNENTYILVKDIEYLKKAMAFLTTKDVKTETMANLIFWYGVKDYFMVFPRFSHFFGQVNNVAKDEQLEALQNFCYDDTSKMFSTAFSYLYIEHNNEDFDFGGITDLVTYTKRSFDLMITNTSWLDDATRDKMLKKLKAMEVVIGYTNKSSNKTFLDELYEDFPILSNSSVSNYILISKYVINKALKFLIPSNNTAIFMVPRPVTFVGAYNGVEKNILVLSLFYPPFYYTKGFNYQKFGGLGSIIGHELSHGFDSAGGGRDETGSVSNWWTPNATLEYQKRLSCFLEQFAEDNTTAFIHNAVFSAESTADCVGIDIAYVAYKKWESIFGTEPRYEGLERYTPDQMFYLNFATQFCMSQMVRRKEDPHNPKPLRVLSAVSNSAFFANVFNCQNGSAMNPVHKCSIYGDEIMI